MVSGVNSVSSYSNGVQNTKKKSPVKTGAAIGAGAGLAWTAVDLVRKRGPLKETFQEGVKLVGKNKALAVTAGSIALTAAVFTGACSAIGTGIGAIVKAVKGGNTAKDA